jgi:hypothetical protein
MMIFLMYNDFVVEVCSRLVPLITLKFQTNFHAEDLQETYI